MTYRLVIDTNILISAVFRDRNPELVFRAVKDSKCTLLTSSEIADEVKRVLNYSKFKRYFTEIKRTPDEVYNEYIKLTEMITPASNLSIPDLRDEKDLLIFACAIGGKADFIVSGDDDLLVLAEIEGIRIVTAAQFLAILIPPSESTGDTSAT